MKYADQDPKHAESLAFFKAQADAQDPFAAMREGGYNSFTLTKAVLTLLARVEALERDNSMLLSIVCPPIDKP